MSHLPKESFFIRINNNQGSWRMKLDPISVMPAINKLNMLPYQTCVIMNSILPKNVSFSTFIFFLEFDFWMPFLKPNLTLKKYFSGTSNLSSRCSIEVAAGNLKSKSFEYKKDVQFTEILLNGFKALSSILCAWFSDN